MRRRPRPATAAGATASSPKPDSRTHRVDGRDPARPSTAPSGYWRRAIANAEKLIAQFISRSHLDTEVGLRDYSVSNRGLRPEFIGTPDQVAERFLRFAEVGVSTFLLQFSPHLPELNRFAEEVIPRVRRLEALRRA